MKKFLNERNNKLFKKLFENQGVKVEGDYDAEMPADKFGNPLQLQRIARKADTKPELVTFFKWVKDQVQELTRGQATDLEIRQAFIEVIKDMKDAVGRVVKNTSEVNVIDYPERGNPEDDLEDLDDLLLET